MRVKLLTLFFLILVAVAKAQDPQYSQFYANKLYVNPAFAGSEEMSRVFLIGRYQWPALDATYMTGTFSVDHYFANVKSGVGLIITKDHVPFVNLNTTDVGVQYAYRLDITENLSFRSGIQGSYVTRAIDFNKLDFSSQYDNWGFQGGNTNEKLIENRISYFNLTAGGLLYSPVFWFGFSTANINRPNQSFLLNESRLPRRTSFHGGYKIYLKEQAKKRYGFKDNAEEVSITVAANYRFEGKSDQLDMGAYVTYNQLIFGVWYKGIPVKNYKKGVQNNESIIGLFGYVLGDFRLGYSYDVTVSKLARANPGGAHELSLTYVFVQEPKGKKKPKPENRKPMCPKF